MGTHGLGASEFTFVGDRTETAYLDANSRPDPGGHSRRRTAGRHADMIATSETAVLGAYDRIQCQHGDESGSRRLCGGY